MFSPPPFLCHLWSWDVHASSGFSSFSWRSSLVVSASKRVYLQILNIKAGIWLQNPAFPATYVQLLSKTSPLKIHNASFNWCGGSNWESTSSSQKCYYLRKVRQVFSAVLSTIAPDQEDEVFEALLSSSGYDIQEKTRHDVKENAFSVPKCDVTLPWARFEWF